MKKQSGFSIGVFDSGFGGLTILRSIIKELPQYNYVYLGDTAHAPYGSRSPEEIYRFTKQGVTFLFENNCSLVILACNTASSDALRKIQQEFLPRYYPAKRVLGVLIPAAEKASQSTKNKRIGVIATEATTKSKAFVREIKKIDSGISVFQKACPLLVPLIEAGQERSPAVTAALKKYLPSFKKKGIDTLILGCTHYGILQEQIKRILGKNIRLISEESLVHKKIKSYLRRHPEIEVSLQRQGRTQFYTTDKNGGFDSLGSGVFGKPIQSKNISL